MPLKVVLDAGHGGSDPGAVYNGRRESDDNLNLALELGQILRDAGIDVVYTRTGDTTQTPFEKATIANQSGADLFISLHRNSSPIPGQYSGVETLVYDDNGNKAELARRINENLTTVGYQNLGVKERPGLVVLRRTNMPAVLVETGFINNNHDNVIYDNQFRQIAEQIADAVIAMQQDFTRSGVYRVQIGLFRMFSNAQYTLMQAISKGFSGEIVSKGEYYAVLIGGTDSYMKAQELERQLNAAGFDTLIVTD
ncbi:MAG: N-acetylmuramoyl-L-alanine amidase [Lachnospiraceae bacterium]|nr:N-acetylmuramoyl-L-alanine amidase [Lachnospiraceae bacterium]